MYILCYHKVGPGSEEGRRLNIEPKTLSKHVSYFQRRGYVFRRADSLCEPWGEQDVCLTFDDAYVSTLTYGVEVLSKAGVTGSIYAVSDCVGGNSSWDLGNERPLAGWDLLVDAQKLGIEIGNHSRSHPFFEKLTQAEQVQQIRDCHQALTEHGISSKSFCLPYGSYNAESEAAIREAGYQVGLALRKRHPKDTDSRQILPRIVIAYSDGIAGLVYKLKIKPLLKRSRD